MKCPKCGYHSFEHLDACKKCKADLSSFKTAHKITPVIVAARCQPSVQTPPSQPATSAAAQDDFLIDNPAIFSSAAAPTAVTRTANEDPVFGEFSFTEEAAAAPADIKENAWDSPAAAEPLTIGNNSDGHDFPDLFGDTPLQEGHSEKNLQSGRH